MTQRPGGAPDRRQHVRIEPKGTVTLHAVGNVYRGRLLNIGAGGMYVATEVPHDLHGCSIDLDVRFDGPLAAWQRLVGRVSRIDTDGLAIVLDGPTAPLLRIIDELATASRASARRISVVLIDEDAARRAAIAAGFSSTGCTVVEVATPLEAIVRLGESHFEPDVVAVADSHTADEMRTFIEREHASSMLVTIGHELLDPAGLANWLSSTSTDLPARIRNLLVTLTSARRSNGAA